MRCLQRCLLGRAFAGKPAMKDPGFMNRQYVWALPIQAKAKARSPSPLQIEAPAFDSLLHSLYLEG